MNRKKIMDEIKVGLLGFGTIGAGVARILVNDSELISRRVGAKLKLARVADVKPGKRKGVKLPKGVFTTDASKVIEDPDIPIVIELIGGKTVARDMVRKSLRAGKHVVTANKALLATHGEELFSIARKNGVGIAFEAAVGGAIPIIRSLREAFVATRLGEIYAIINGTSNYILTEMTKHGADFSSSLEKAKELGYAEADPTFDIDGADAAHKLALLVMLAFGTPVKFSGIYKEGITEITPLDMAFAKEFGYRIKLLAIARGNDEGIEARVHPTLIPEDHVLAGIEGVLNAVYMQGEPMGQSMLVGRGAGMMPTAGAVVADVVEIARDLAADSLPQRAPMRAWPEESFRKIPLRDIKERRGEYYLRCKVLDQPGVLSRISGILGEHRISIAQVLQKDRKVDGAVPIFLLTHEALEKDLMAAVKKIDRLRIARGKTAYLRIEK